jgi:hypothetical protein
VAAMAARSESTVGLFIVPSLMAERPGYETTQMTKNSGAHDVTACAGQPLGLP